MFLKEKKTGKEMFYKEDPYDAIRNYFDDKGVLGKKVKETMKIEQEEFLVRSDCKVVCMRQEDPDQYCSVGWASSFKAKDR